MERKDRGQKNGDDGEWRSVETCTPAELNTERAHQQYVLDNSPRKCHVAWEAGGKWGGLLENLLNCWYIFGCCVQVIEDLSAVKAFHTISLNSMLQYSTSSRNQSVKYKINFPIWHYLKGAFGFTFVLYLIYACSAVLYHTGKLFQHTQNCGSNSATSSQALFPDSTRRRNELQNSTLR